MLTRTLNICLILTSTLVLIAGVGCSKKGMQVTSDGEYAGVESGGEDVAGGGTPGSRRGSASGGMAEHDLEGRQFSHGGGGSQAGVEESDLGGRAPGGGRGQGGAFGSEADDDAYPDDYEELGPGGEPVAPALPPGMAFGKSGEGEGDLGGFDTFEPGRDLSEDRVEGGGTAIAKAEPSDTFESQIDALHDDLEGRLDRRDGDAPGELEDVFFAYDSWRISEDAKELLLVGAQWLEENPGARLLVEGHCDERGSSAYNLVLGEKRARAVRGYLIELGVSSKRVKIVSYGEERPFCSQSTEMCYQLNRRGHFVVR